MKIVVYSDDAERELEDIFQFISANYPAIYRSFEARLRSIITRIGTWPESAPEVAQRPGVRSIVFIRYPYRLFYRVIPERVEVLHIRHSARDDEALST